MKTHKYDPKAGYQRKVCQVCNRMRWTCQHHCDQGRHSDIVIDVCDNLPDKVLYKDPCHKKIHNPTSFGLPSDWAYKNGYLKKADGKIRKKPSKAKMPEYINIDGFQTFLKKSVKRAKPLDFSKRGRKSK